MSEKEYKEKTENLFKRNTILINELETANNRITELEAQIEKMKKCANCEKWKSNQSIIACGICECIDVRKEL